MIAWLSASQPHGSRFVFLDRDGVLNANRPDYVKSAQELCLFPDAQESLGLLGRHEVNVIIISNQSGLNRGIIDWNAFWEMHGAMLEAIEDAGGRILAAFYCPHRPDEGCSCRKPAPGMIRAACDTYRLSPDSAFFIGDSSSDLEAAVNAGCTGVLLDRECAGGRADCSMGAARGGHYHTLLEAVRALFGN